MKKTWRRILSAMILAVMIWAGAIAPLPGAGAEVFLNQEKPADWEERDLLRITALSFIQNDAFVLECGGEVMLLDGGSALRGDDLHQFLAEHDMLHVKMIFNSHPHDDHIEALYLNIKNSGLTADEFISPFPADYKLKGDYQRKMVSLLEEKGIPFRQMLPGEQLQLGGTVMTLYRAEKGDTNATSGVLMIRFGKASILMTGDISGEAEKLIMADVGEEALKADILKAPHHGIMRMVSAFLTAVSPELGIVTSRKDTKAQEQFENKKIPCIWTGLGDTVLETDGTDWYVNQENKWVKK